MEEDHLIWARSKALQEAGYELVPASDLIMELRAAKDAEEIAAVKHACAQIIEVYDELWANLQVGDSEADVNARVGLLARPPRRQPPRARTSSSAPTPATRTARPGSARCRTGDVIVADIAAQFGGYWGDMTRCAHAGHAERLGRARPGTSSRRPTTTRSRRRASGTRPATSTRRSESIVEAHPEVGACLHGAGHAIGTEIHEPPFLVATSEIPLREGMIFTVEPGIYHSEIGGIRLEDDILVSRRRAGQPVAGSAGPPGAADRRGALARVHPAHLLARAAGLHRAPAATAARVQEHPAAVAPGAAVQPGHAGGVGEQGDGVGGDREAHAAGLLA